MKKRTGFTLVELVVVIMILGILAGVAAPRLLDTSADATDNAVRQSLATIRNAIELYSAENGTKPTLTAPGTAPGDFHDQLAQYLRGQTFPASPVHDDPAEANHVAAGTAPDGNTGWMYDSGTGNFICNSTDSTKDGVPYASL